MEGERCTKTILPSSAAGFPGLAAALLLHRQGHHVTLYERFEAPRAVGSGLMVQPTGLAVLAALGLAERSWRRARRWMRCWV